MNQLRHFIKDTYSEDKVCPYCDAGDPTSIISTCNCKKLKKDKHSKNQYINVAGTPVSLDRP